MESKVGFFFIVVLFSVFREMRVKSVLMKSYWMNELIREYMNGGFLVVVVVSWGLIKGVGFF